MNAHGERFVREDHPSVHQIERGIYDNPVIGTGPSSMLRCWHSPSRSFLTGVGIASPRISDTPMFSRAMTLEELAFRAGINASSRAETSTTTTGGSKRPSRPLWQKHRPMTIEKAPFYAIAMQGWTLVSFAGLSVNRNFQVLDPQRKAISNLYAIGEVIGAGATSGAAYTNGMLVTPAITFGRLLGSALARRS